MKSKIVAIVPAAGAGDRMGADKKKQFLFLGDRHILAHTLARLASSDNIDEIVLVAPEDDIAFCQCEVVDKYAIGKVTKIVAGGITRSRSVSLGFASLPEDTDYVLVHDGARPFVTHKMIDEVVSIAKIKGAAACAIRVKDTLKKVSEGQIINSVTRDDMVRIQTPQCFRFDVLQSGINAADRNGFIPTDESSLVERLGLPVAIAQGSEMNIKITTQEDLKIAEAFLGLL